MTVSLDLGPSDVHLPTSPSKMRPLMDDETEMNNKSFECLLTLDATRCSDDEDNKDHEDEDEEKTEENQRDMISSEKRKSLPGEKFAIPEDRKFPVDTPARTRNAASRLEQQKGSMPSEKYSKARSRIGAAARSHGIDSEYNKRKMDDEGGEEGDAEMKRACRGESIALASKSAEGKEVWIQVAKQGRFLGHRSGPFEMTSQTFAEIIHNFNAQQNRAIPVDFEHASEQPSTEGNIAVHGAPAQGWITKLEVRGDGNLWGLVRWGDLARQYIKSGQYRFLSPAIVFKSSDRETGKEIGARLSSVALTNNPFLDGMAPLAAKREEKNIDQNVVKVIGMSLGIRESEANDAVLVTAMLRHFASRKALAETMASALRSNLHLPLTMSVDDVFNTARIACGEISSPVAIPAATNNQPPVSARNEESIMGDNDKGKELETQVSSLTLKLTAAETEKTKLCSDHATQLATLTAENEGLKKQLDEFRDKELQTVVDTAIQVWGEKKGLTADSRPHLLRFAKNDREGFNALYPAPAAGQPRPVGAILATGSHPVAGPTLNGVNPGGQVIVLKDVMADHKIPTVTTLANKMMAEAKAHGVEMSQEEAFGKAHQERIDLINKAANERMAAGNGG